jgi:hypothetical protein
MRNSNVISFDDSRSKKLELEQKKRNELILKKKKKELQLQAEHQKRLDEMKILSQKRKEEEDNKRIELERIELLELEATGGIKYSGVYEIFKIDGEDDKVTLPENVLLELSNQDAFSNGVFFFELQCNISGIIRKTHCGVREFSSSPNTIGLPPKVIDSLTDDSSLLTTVNIKYIRLPKISYVKLQPKHNEFFAVGPVKKCLEENLKFHSTLTINDVINVWYRGKSHALRVVEMKPGSQGTLIDIDVEVDLDVSEENKNIIEENKNKINEETIIQRNYARVDNHSIDNSNINSVFSFNSDQTKPQNDNYVLPPEPDTSLNTLQIKIKISDGTICLSRKFLLNDQFILLFKNVSNFLKISVSKINLTSRFPNHIYTVENTNNGMLSLEEGGFSGQQILFASIMS